MKERDTKSPGLASGVIWGIFFGVVFSLIFYQAASGATVVWCAEKDDGDCLRQWLSALGSWGAVVAAALTIIYLRKQILTQQHQIDQAAEQHRLTLLASRTPIQELANRTTRVCARALRDLNMIRDYLNPANVTPMDAHFGGPGPADYFATRVEELIAHLEAPIFDEFEQKIGSDAGTTGKSKAVEELRKFVEFARQAPEISPTCPVDAYRNQFKSSGFVATIRANFYLRECHGIAAKFLMPGEQIPSWELGPIPPAGV